MLYSSIIATEVSSLIILSKMDSVVASIYLCSSVFLALIRAVAHAAATAVLAAALFLTAAFFHRAALTGQRTAGEWGVR